MELKKHNKGPNIVLNNPLESNPLSGQTKHSSGVRNDPLSSNFTRSNTNISQTSYVLNNPLMNNPLQSNNLYSNKNFNIQNKNTNVNLNMINMNNNNLYNQNVNKKPNMANYTVKYGNEKYNLSIECNNIYFCFKLEPINNIVLNYYKGEFNLSTIINKMNVVINSQNAFEQLNKIVEKAINEENFKIIYDKQKKKMIIRFSKNITDYSSDFELEEISNNKKLFNNIFEELNLLKFQQIQYMTLFKNHNFISNKDAIHLINENKNEFENKIKNIDSICNSHKNEITNLKKELNDAKSGLENKAKNIDSDLKKDEENNKTEIKNEDISQLKNEITNIKSDFEEKIKNLDVKELKNEIERLKKDFEDQIKNINLNEVKNSSSASENENKNQGLDELKNEIENLKNNFDNKIKEINLDEFKNGIKDMKTDFDAKLSNINLDEIKQEVNNVKINLEDKFKNIKLDEIDKKIDILKNDFDNKIKNINLDEVKNEIKTNKKVLEEKFKDINLEAIKQEIIELKNTFDAKIKNINTEELKQQINEIKTDYESKIKAIDLKDSENINEINNIKNEIGNIKTDFEKKLTSINSVENSQINEFNNLKTDFLQLKEKQANLDNENNELKKELIKLKEDQTVKENELKNEIKLLKEENEKLKSENEKIKQEINSQNAEKEEKNKINTEKENINANKMNEEISSLKQANNQMKEDKSNLEKEISQLKSQLSLIIEKENKKEEKKRLIEEKKEKIYQEQVNHKFAGDPEKLKFKFDILKTNNIFFIDEFAVYVSITDKKEYLASGNKNNYNIDIYDIKNNIFYTSLKAHKNGTPTVRYFLNNKKKKEYLISADFLKTVIIWDLNNDYNIIQKIKIDEYKGSILSTILYFDVKVKENEYNDFIITSSDDENEDFSKVYSFKDGSFITNISNTNKNTSYYLLPWEFNDKYYIVELCLNKICINNLLSDENYAELVSNPESSHFGGFIYDEKFLCCSSENGQIRIWNLDKKCLIKKIEKIGSCYFEVIPWNEKFVISANYKNNSFDIFDIEKGELVKQVSTSHNVGVRAVKKIFLPNYGECLITSGHDNIIKMWSI